MSLTERSLYSLEAGLVRTNEEDQIITDYALDIHV